MKLSLQISRGLIALALCAAIGAYAVAQPNDDDNPKVAHNRVDIVTLPDAEAPHWAVASVRVGNPKQIAPPTDRRVATQVRSSATRG